MTTVEPVLSQGDADRLAELEGVIGAGLQTFVKVGTALAEVRDARLYRAEHDTFESYCLGRWNLRRAHAYRLIEAADVVTSLSPIGDTPPPTTESQARELARAEPQQRAEVWAKAVEDTAGRPTAAAVKAALTELADIKAKVAAERQEAEEFWNGVLERTPPETVERIQAERPFGLALVAVRRCAREIAAQRMDPEHLAAHIPDRHRPDLADLEAAYHWLGRLLTAASKESAA